MITATCHNNDCPKRNQDFLFVGEPEVVMCGECRQPTALTNLQPDPPVPDED
jgi:hypothetical protein